MSETLALDPAAVAINRTAWDITQYVGESGPDWGDAAIEQFLADIESGSLPVDFRIPNRVVTIPLLLLKSSSGTAYTFDQVRRRFQQKAALFQRKGGWISRQTPIGTVYADVIGATLKLGGSTAQALWGIDADAVLTLTCLPDWYGAETDLGTFTGATGEVAANVGVIAGDYPARARVIVKDTATKRRHGLLWAHRYYNAAATAQLIYGAYQMTLVNGSLRINATTGATDAAGLLVKSGTPIDDTNWMTAISTDIVASGPLTHEGSYRVWARVGTDVLLYDFPSKIRLRWDVGDFTKATTNPAVTMPKVTLTDMLPAGVGFALVDLGEVRLDASPIGTHRWRGEIQIASRSPKFYFDKFYFAPVDTGYGKLIASDIESDVGDIGLLDKFTGVTLATALSGSGGWTTSGPAPDFVYGREDGAGTGTSDVVTRTINTGAARVAIATTPVLTLTDIQTDIKFLAPISTPPYYNVSLWARYTDSANNVEFRYSCFGPAVDETTLNVFVNTSVAGQSISILIRPDRLTWPKGIVAGWMTMRLVIDTTGRFFVWLVPRGQAFGDPNIVGQAVALAAGNSLASGKTGFSCTNTSTGATLMFDNFIAKTPPTPDAVIYESRGVELRFDSMYRDSLDGIGAGQVGNTTGDLLRLPASGLEARNVELLVKPTRGDFGYMADFDPAGGITARVLYRPCYLFLP